MVLSSSSSAWRSSGSWSIGELTDRRRAAVPSSPRSPGWSVPAVIYPGHQPGRRRPPAWGVVISTDTAFLLALLGPRRAQARPSCGSSSLTLAVADDIGALTVIALFYTDVLRLVPLGPVAGLAADVGLLRWLQVVAGAGSTSSRSVVLVGGRSYQSGVHPTLAGSGHRADHPRPTRRGASRGRAGRTAARAFRQSAESGVRRRRAAASIERSVPSRTSGCRSCCAPVDRAS